jgi:glycerophosphoryl diester phosphodiesterase
LTINATAPTLELVVELKERGLAGAVLPACADHPGGVLVQSFDGDALGEAREVAPGVARSLLFAGDPRANLAAAADLDCAAVGAHHELCTPAFVDAAHHRGLDVYGWTVADRGTAGALVEAGVDAVISDVPGVLG